MWTVAFALFPWEEQRRRMKRMEWEWSGWMALAKRVVSVGESVSVKGEWPWSWGQLNLSLSEGDVASALAASTLLEMNVVTRHRSTPKTCLACESAFLFVSSGRQVRPLPEA